MKNQADRSSASPPAVGKRKLSDYFFFYSWADLNAVSTLRNVWVALYMLAGFVGYLSDPLGPPAASAFCMAALANYPAYWLGVRLQAHLDKASVQTNERMVWQIGNLALIASCVGGLYAAKWLFTSP